MPSEEEAMEYQSRDVLPPTARSVQVVLVGLSVGEIVGLSVGVLVGLSVGVLVGLSVGVLVGLSVGEIVGAAVPNTLTRYVVVVGS
jgi:hypothetical protein